MSTVRSSFVAVCVLKMVCLCGFVDAQDAEKKTSTSSSPLVTFLNEAKSSDGIAFYQKKLTERADDPESIASLGLLQMVFAIEGISQDYYRFGFADRRISIPGLIQIPVPTSPNPEQISYADARKVLLRFLDRLVEADKTLSGFKPNQLKLQLDVSQISVDIDGLGQKESLMLIMSRMNNPRGAVNRDTLKSMVFTFDDADVYWLRGYINVLSTVVEVVLAHNWQEAFDRSAHLFFPSVNSDFRFLANEKKEEGWFTLSFVDIIALVHMFRFEVEEPKRMEQALARMETIIRLSRETWKLIRLETDNEEEWIPNANQTSIVINNQLGGQMGVHWEKVLDQAESILQGKELLPYWRGFEGANRLLNARSGSYHPTLGINFRKIFINPKRFDLVLWIQGTGMQPFLEEGKILNGDAWESIAGPFGGNLPFFAIWFN